jgi:hypothetical protein
LVQRATATTCFRHANRSPVKSLRDAVAPLAAVVFTLIHRPIRMIILREGRVAFLEFLRNLSSQVMILTVALFIGTSIEARLGGWSTAWRAALCASVLLLFFAAALANVTVFVETCLDALGRDGEAPARRGKRERIVFRWTAESLRAAWKRHAWSIVALAVLLECGFIAVFVTASFAAAKLMR